LGLQLIYLDGGSGADEPVPETVIKEVEKNIDIPLIVGGGLNTIERVNYALNSGADLIVVGTAIEKDQNFLIDVSMKINEMNEALNVH
jgi:heptaprenylglyceryl phosphate synthase